MNYKFLSILLGISLSIAVFFSGNQTHASLLDCSTATEISVPIIECEALLALYDSTDGDNWYGTTNRDTDSDVCDRYGIDCTNILGQDRVTSINFDVNNLNGTLSAALSGLTEILHFNITNEQISGTLPTERSTWTNITDFNVSNNQISGTLPTERSTWTNITDFNVSNNQISGTLPTERSTWTNITDFNVNSNEINGTLPTERSTWTNITDFDVNSNEINGTLPTDRSTWVNIQTFAIGLNDLTGTLPTERSTWTNIQSFDVGSNNLTGTLPTERSTWTNIQSFGVGSNNLTGTLPTERSTWTNIYQFYILQNNDITGTLPTERSTWTNIQTFIAGANALTGTLPTERSTWTAIESFVVSNNEIHGTLPTERSTWTNMLSFGAAGNDLTGTLPTERSTWDGIYEFYIGGNDLTGTLPTERSTWTGIRYFEVGSNDLTGTLPTDRSTWTSILNFSANDNDLTGTLPTERSTWTGMRYFDIDHNTLAGTLPTERSTWTAIESFDVSYNDMIGFIPDSWAASRPDIPMQYSYFQYNCLNTTGYDGDTRTWIQANTILFDQDDDCTPSTTTDLSVTKTSQTTIATDGETIEYTIEYVNNGPDTAVNVVLEDLPGLGLVLNSVSTAYGTGLGGALAYGIVGDVCYDDLIADTSGPYAAAINQVAGGNFEGYLTGNTSYTGGANRGQRWVTTLETVFMQGSFQENMIAWFNIDITAIDSSCGVGTEETIQIALGNLASGATGSVTVVFQVDGDAIGSGQTTLLNTTSIASDTAEDDYDNNEDTYELSYQTSEGEGEPEEPEEPTPPTGGGPTLVPDNCPDGDYSPSYYDEICGSEPVIPPTPTPPTTTTTSDMCKYTDGNFKHYVFIDVVGTKYVSAVDTMLYHCLVHGYNNNGVDFGPNNGLKLGELYKVFTRMSLLDFNLNHPGKGWSHGYYLAGEKAGLWEGIDTTRSQETIVTSAELLQVTKNFLAYKGKATNIQLPEGMTNRLVYRGEFSVFVDDLLADYIERIPTTSVEQTTTTVQTHESACIAADCVPVNSRRTGESSIDISHHKKASPLPDHVLMRTKPRDLPVYIDLQHGNTPFPLYTQKKLQRYTLVR